MHEGGPIIEKYSNWGGKGRIVWNGKFVSILFFFLGGGGGVEGGGVGVKSNCYTNRLNCGYLFQESWMTIAPMLLSICGSKANTNLSNIAGVLLLL